MSADAGPIPTSLTFRDAMVCLGAAVSVITTDGPAGRRGMTAAAVCSVWDSPASLLLCINRNARIHDALQQNSVFAVNLLVAGQEDLSGLFSSADTPMEQRFAGPGGRLMTGLGVPGLAAAQLTLACTVSRTMDASTHNIVLGEVREILDGKGQGGGAGAISRNDPRL